MDFTPVSIITLSIILLAFGTIFFLIKQFLERDEKIRILELRKENTKTSTPIRLQAYERIAMLLERIHPRSLFIRINPSDKINIVQYKNLLQQTIQQEFEHNISQQIYISRDLWEEIIAAKNQVILEINETANSIPNQLPATALFKAFQEKLDEDNEEVQWIIDNALIRLQKEVSQQF